MYLDIWAIPVLAGMLIFILLERWFARPAIIPDRDPPADEPAAAGR